MIIDLQAARARRETPKPIEGMTVFDAATLDRIVATLTECREIEHEMLALTARARELDERLAELRSSAACMLARGNARHGGSGAA